MARSLDGEEGEVQWHEDTVEPLQWLVEYVAGLSEAAIGERGSFSVFLSGSNFLISCLRKLTEEPHFGKIDWSNWHLVWANETVVPPDQLDIIDYTVGHDGLLSKVPAAQVHIIEVKLSPQDIASVDYELVLRELIRTRGSALPLAQTSEGYPRFDLILVGTEIDEIVASLSTFPPVVEKLEIRTALSDEDSNSCPPPLQDRVQFSLPVMNSGANVSFLAARSGNADEMKLICSPTSPFGDIPADPTAAAPCKANLVWFKQIPRQMEVPVPFDVAIGEGAIFGCCTSSICDHTFHWQFQVGGIYRPTLEVVEKQVNSFLIDPVQRELVLEHARNGLKCENLWNWGEAIEHYKAMDAELGKSLEASERKDNDLRTHFLYLWLHTWASVPILWFQHFVKGETVLELNECIAGWEKLRNQWPSQSSANLSVRRHQALAMLELSHHDKNCIDVKGQAAAVELYPNERSPADGDFMETLPRMSLHLHQHWKFAADRAKAKQWLQKTLANVAGQPDISMPRFSVIWRQYLSLNDTGDILKSPDIVDTEVAEDLVRKLEGDLEKRKGSRAQIKSSGSEPVRDVGDVAARWRDLKFWMAFERHRRQFLGVGQFMNDKSVEYSLKIVEKDLSTDTLVDCLRTSKYFIIQERFHDALECLDVASQKLPREPGFRNLERKVVLSLMISCHIGLSINKPEAGFSHITTPSSPPLVPYLQNVMGLDEAAIQAATRQVEWERSDSYRSTGSSDVHLENAISCYREELALSSLPGGFTYLRFSDLSQLGDQLVQKESSLFLQWCCGGEVTMEVYLEAWNDAWGVLQKFLELSSRLMHVRWHPLYIETLTAGSTSTSLFETLYGLLSHKMTFAQGCFLKTLQPRHPGVNISKAYPAVKENITFRADLDQKFRSFCAKFADIDCALPAYILRKLMYSERGRARTLMLQGGSLLTTEARDHFLRFSLDDNVAEAAMRRSISACGGGTVFVSLSTPSWRIHSTCFYQVKNPFSGSVQGFMWEIEIQDEECLSLRGILQKTLDLLSSAWLSSQLEEKSRQLDECLEQLYEIIVRPIEFAFGQHMSPEQKLIFCASKDLTSMPFPILRNRETGRYLFQDHTVSVTPSLRVLHPLSQRYEALKKRPLATGNAAAGVVIADPKYPDEGSTKPVWRRLQGSGNEANKICSLFSGSSGTYQVENLQREKATVENLLCQARLPSSELSFQGFIHVAAHAKVDKKRYTRGVLVLSHVSSTDDDDDNSDSDSDGEGDKEGLQNTRGVAAPGSAFGEVAAGICRGPVTSKVASKDAAMIISADGIVSCGFEWSTALVVLSACDSVKGERYPEGVHNLPRAFMMAGVPCVVVSQWKVNDDIAPKLMEVFYTRLREGKDVASALRFAMCQMLEEKHRLYHFAPFLVWGLPSVCLPEELQTKPLAHGKPISKDIPAGPSSNLPAMEENNNDKPSVAANHDSAVTGNAEPSSSDPKTPSSPETASSSGSERETVVPPSPAENSAPEAQSATPSSSLQEEFQELPRIQVLPEDFTQNYLLEKTTEGICVRIGARSLTITLGDDTRYWEWVYRPKGALFSEAAFLKEASRLKAKGRFQCSLPPGTYTLSWRLLCYKDIIAFAGPLFYGFIDPLTFSLEVTGNEPLHTQCRLTASGARVSMHQHDGVQQPPAWRWDPSDWMELDVGEFSVASDDSPVEVKFSMEETDEQKSKSNLLLDGIVIRPSALIRRDEAILATRTAGSGSGLEDTSKGFVNFSDTGTAHREILLDRPAPQRGNHDAWNRELLRFKEICRIGLAKEEHSSMRAAKAESQLETMREEINTLKATNTRLEDARRASKLVRELQRIMEEKSALEADNVRLQEQVVKTEANVKGKNKVAEDDV